MNYLLTRARENPMKSLVGCWLLLSFVVVSVAAPIACGQDELAGRLTILEKRIEDERKKEHIPGLAIAVVKDDKIVLAKGFGQRDLESGQPVTGETLFAVGSTTKAFTSALIAMLADDQVMDWDDPVTKFIPEFELQIDAEDEQVTIRDLLCHRTGFTRMGLLWASARITRPEVFERAVTAKPFADFRKSFHYNNVMFLAAGYAAGRAADSDWESLIAERIFVPLGMADSSTSITDASQSEHLSKGYVWNEDENTHDLLPMRNIDLVGPAGSINSNIVDMAQWLRFQLGKGNYDGRQLVDADVLGETWKQQIEMAPGAGYGMGWMLRNWNGQQVVEHGGNIDGFAAQVAMLPKENIGFVLLANVTATPLQGKSISLVFDTLLGDASADETGESSAPANTDGLLGKYIANFGPFRDARFTVLMKDGNLAVDVPGQREYELKPPNDEGKWYFALTDQIAVSFERNDDGKGVLLTMYQAGMEFECPREGIEVEPEIALEQLQPLVGTYRDEEEDFNFKIVIMNNWLTIDAGDRGLIPLNPPDDEGKRSFRMNPKVGQVRFNKADDGSIKSLTRIRPGKDDTEMSRVETAEEDKIPSIDELMEIVRKGYGADRISEFGDVKLNGELTFVHQGAKGGVTYLLSGTDRMSTDIDLGKLGYIRTAFDGQDGWQDSSFAPFEKLGGARMTQLALKHPLWILGPWRERFDNAAVVSRSEVDKKPVFVVKLTDKELPSRTLYVDASSGLLLKEETSEIARGIGGLPVTYTFSDYRPVNGVMIPFKATTRTAQSGESVVQLESAATDVDLQDSDFRIDPPAKNKSN